MNSSHTHDNCTWISKDKNYIAFSNSLETLIGFLKSLSTNVGQSGHAITCITRDKVFFLSPTLLDSACQTLGTIRHCCLCGCISDANILARKVRDDLMLYLYILEVLARRKVFSPEQLGIYDFGDINEFTSAIYVAFDNLTSGKLKDDDDLCVDAWFENSIDTLTWTQKSKLSIDNYLKYIRKNNSIDEVITTFGLTTEWELIRKTLNNFTHVNGNKYVLNTEITVHNASMFYDALLELSDRLEYILCSFAIFLGLIQPLLLQSSDYIDYKDSNIDPPDDCQYWIAPFLLTFFEQYSNRFRPELIQFLASNNRYGMHFK